MKKKFVLAIALVAIALTQGGCGMTTIKSSMDGVERVVVDPSYGEAALRILTVAEIKATEGKGYERYRKYKVYASLGVKPPEESFTASLEEAMKLSQVATLQTGEHDKAPKLLIQGHVEPRWSLLNVVKYLFDPFNLLVITRTVGHSDCTLDVTAIRADGERRTYHGSDSVTVRLYWNDRHGQKARAGDHKARLRAEAACAQQVASDMAADVDWLFPQKDELALR